MKAGIIGIGHIGKELFSRLLERGWEITIARSSGIYASGGEKIDELSNWFSYFKKVDVACLCIPSVDDGRIAFGYIKPLAEQGIPVVTCEKGALSNYYTELKPWMGRIGYSATVGGGTRLLSWLKERLGLETEEIHLIVNGTLNYIFSELSQGRALDEVVNDAKTSGYAEPGAGQPWEVIASEANGDIPKKVAILLNICGFGEVQVRDIEVKAISERDRKRLLEKTFSRRYIISLTREAREEEVIGGFNLRVRDWYVSAGFKNYCQNPLFLRLVPPGVNNAVLVHGSDGTYTLTGPGAGAVPTVGTMMKDIDNLLSQK